ncbi:MAG: MnmC family methyltransferase [Nodosilinea sp.]
MTLSGHVRKSTATAPIRCSSRPAGLCLPLPESSTYQLSADRRWVDNAVFREDARQRIRTLDKQRFQADVIFFDPFSPPHCPELWAEEFMQQVATYLHAEGKLVTYSCAAAVRTTFRLAGLSIGPINAAGRRWPGTLAQIEARGLAPLSQQEQEHLLTRAAVPYRDPTPRDNANTIRQRRQHEQVVATLVPTSIWRKRWLPPHQNVSSDR